MANLWRNVLVFLHVLNVVFEYLQMCIKRQWNKTRYWIIDKVKVLSHYRAFRPYLFLLLILLLPNNWLWVAGEGGLEWTFVLGFLIVFNQTRSIVYF